MNGICLVVQSHAMESASIGGAYDEDLVAFT